MEDDEDVKLKEEIEAELDKISISSLEKDDVDSDSKSETQSDDSDTVSVKCWTFEAFNWSNLFRRYITFSCVLCTYLIFNLRITFKPGVPILFWYQGPVSWQTVFPQTGRGREMVSG